MNNTILNNENTVYYAVAVRGRVVSGTFSDRSIAEMEKMKLPPDQQVLAEVIIVTADGRMLLLG